MKFGKRMRDELPASLKDCSLDYKALKKVAKRVRASNRTNPDPEAWAGVGVGSLMYSNGRARHDNCHDEETEQEPQSERDEGVFVREFFQYLETERMKVDSYYRDRERWCFRTLEKTRASLFSLTHVNAGGSSRKPGVQGAMGQTANLDGVGLWTVPGTGKQIILRENGEVEGR
ncbi:unnamed protein product [Choristocarpus tenellus]